MKHVFVLVLFALLASCASSNYPEARPITPTPVSPSNGVDIVVGSEIEFVWSASVRASSYQFHLFNRNNGDIDQYGMRNLRPSQVCAADRCSVKIKVELPINFHHAWRVRAMNLQGPSGWTRSIFNVIEP